MFWGKDYSTYNAQIIKWRTQNQIRNVWGGELCELEVWNGQFATYIHWERQEISQSCASNLIFVVFFILSFWLCLFYHLSSFVIPYNWFYFVLVSRTLGFRIRICSVWAVYKTNKQTQLTFTKIKNKQTQTNTQEHVVTIPLNIRCCGYGRDSKNVQICLHIFLRGSWKGCLSIKCEYFQWFATLNLCLYIIIRILESLPYWLIDFTLEWSQIAKVISVNTSASILHMGCDLYCACDGR